MGVNVPPPAGDSIPLDPTLVDGMVDTFFFQMKISAQIFEILAPFHPFFESISEACNEALKSLRFQLRDYNKEENLLSENPLFHSFNSANPYHSFLEGQKIRKFSLENALVQVRTLKTLFSSFSPFPSFFPQIQQMENFIRANLAFTFTFHRPDWNLEFEHEVVESLDFTDIVKFPVDKEKSNGRNMLLIAPISGHFSTLLRKTIESLHTAGYTVYITDWKSPFDVPKSKGAFSIDRSTEEILNAYKIVQKDGGLFDALAVCQPSPETMTATAYAEAKNLPKPRSVVLMAGPIDVSKSPTGVNLVSQKLTPDVLDSLKLMVPEGKYKGAGREVYPAPLQIMSFMSAKPEDHMRKYRNLAYKTTPFSFEEEKILAFYKEYFAVMDLPHEFYKETVNRVFRGNEWATGIVDFNGEKIDFSKMRTPLVTIEGERDDICGIGQTSAAHTIAPNTQKSLHIGVPGSGHYGVFAGEGFRNIVLPLLDKFLHSLLE